MKLFHRTLKAKGILAYLSEAAMKRGSLKSRAAARAMAEARKEDGGVTVIHQTVYVSPDGTKENGDRIIVLALMARNRQRGCSQAGGHPYRVLKLRAIPHSSQPRPGGE